MRSCRALRYIHLIVNHWVALEGGSWMLPFLILIVWYSAVWEVFLWQKKRHSELAAPEHSKVRAFLIRIKSLRQVSKSAIQAMIHLKLGHWMISIFITSRQKFIRTSGRILIRCYLGLILVILTRRLKGGLKQKM